MTWQLTVESDISERRTVVLSACNACVLPAAVEEGRGNQWVTEHVGEGGEEGGVWGGVRQSHPHRTVSTGLNSWEQSRSPSFCCCCCVLLQKPHMEPHVTANTNSRVHFAGTRTAQELPLQGWQKAAIIIRRAGTHTSSTHAHSRWNNRNAKRNASLLQILSRKSPFVSKHRPVCKFVRKVTAALWLMLTRGSLLKGECQTQSHSCLAVTACTAHMQWQIRSLLVKIVVV